MNDFPNFYRRRLLAKRCGSVILPVLLLVSAHFAYATNVITQLWLKPLGAQPVGSPSLGPTGTVFVGTQYALFALNPDSSTKWVYGYGEGFIRPGSAVPLPDGGVVYVPTDGRITRLNASGQVVRQLKVGFGTSHAIAVAGDGTIYYGDRNGKIYAINPDISMKWSFTTGDEIYGGPTIGRDGTIYCGSNDKKLYALNPDGTKKWDLPLAVQLQLPPAIGADGTLYVVGSSGTLFAISSVGVKLWESAGMPATDAQPTVATNGIVYCTAGGRVFAINPGGTQRWSVDLLEGSLSSPILLADGSIYVVGSSRLHHLESSGALRRTYRNDMRASELVVAADGTIYVGHKDNSFAALSGDIAPASGGWPMMQHDPSRNGRLPVVPSVELFLPVSGSTYVSGHPIPLRATVLELAPVDQVDFYRGSNLLRSVSAAPFAASWESFGSGVESFSAVARSGSLSITSAPGTINLLPPQPNGPPAVGIAYPTNNASVVAGDELRLTAQATDADGAALSVEFFDGDRSLGVANYPDFAVTIAVLDEGEHLFRAVATDNFGATATSSVARVYAVLKKWEFGVEIPALRSPALGTNGNILLGSSEWIYELNPAGTPVWIRRLASSSVRSTLSVAEDGIIYFGSSERFWARNPDGTAKWSFDVQGAVTDAPSIAADGTIYCGPSFGTVSTGTPGKLFAINPDGTKKWDYPNYLGPQSIGLDGFIYVSINGLTAIKTNGQFAWQFPVGGGLISAPAIGADGTIYFGSANSGRFFALTPAGTEKWVLSTSSGVSGASPSIGLDGTIYCGTINGNLLAIRPNGTLKWSLDLGAIIQGTPAIAQNGSLYVGAGRKFFNVSSEGVKVWEFVPSSASNFRHSALILKNGDVVVTTDDKAFLLAGNSGPAAGPWPMFMQNPRHTGRAVQPPYWVQQPLDVKVNQGATAAFQATAGGSAPLSYRWQHDGNNLADDMRVNGAATPHLVLNNVQTSDAGTYTVSVSNSAAAIVSLPAILSVNLPPVVNLGRTEFLLVSPNGTNAIAVLDASLSSDPESDPLGYSWFLNGQAEAFATGVVAVVTLPVGTNSLTLVVNDGMAQSAQEFTVEVLTTSTAVERLALLAAEEADRPNPLIASLYAALASIDRSQPETAINQLEAFQNKVLAQIAPVDPALADELLAAAQEIIVSLQSVSVSAVPLEITSVGRGNDGKPRMKIRGVPGRVHIVEVSTNMLTWEMVGVAQSMGGNDYEFGDKITESPGARFYRIASPK